MQKKEDVEIDTLSFLHGDEENGHHACIDGHLTTAYNPGMRLLPLPVTAKFNL